MIPINFGQRIERRIDPADENETYTFDSNAGDRVRIVMSAISSELAPEIRLYNPDGTLASSVYRPANPDGPSNAVLDELELTQEGTYTIIAGDRGANDTGDYTLNLQRTNNPDNAIPINFGNRIEDDINLDGEWDTYTFDANAEDRVRIVMSAISSELAPEIRLYNPDGTLASSVYRPANPDGPSNAVLDGLELTQEGTYTIIAGDRGANDTGDYTLNLQHTNNSDNDTFLGNIVNDSLDEVIGNYRLNGVGDNSSLLDNYGNDPLTGDMGQDLIRIETSNYSLFSSDSVDIF